MTESFDELVDAFTSSLAGQGNGGLENLSDGQREMVEWISRILDVDAPMALPVILDFWGKYKKLDFRNLFAHQQGYLLADKLMEDLSGQEIQIKPGYRNPFIGMLMNLADSVKK